MLVHLAKESQAKLIFVSHDETLMPFFSRKVSMSELNSAGTENVN